MTVVLAFTPDSMALLLLLLYTIGPFFFLASVICLIVSVKFVSCCNDQLDNCTAYFPYKELSDYTMILLASLIFSCAVCLSMIDAFFSFYYFRSYRANLANLMPMYI